MNLKKLKRLLSLTLTAAMVASMISVPVNAETVTDNTAAAMEEMIADPADEDVADDADGTDTADKVEDVTDKKEDSDVVDETENSDEADETEDEGTAEAAEEELFNARKAGDGTTGEGTGDSGTATPPEASSPIIVGDGEGQKTLEEAIALAIAEGSNQKTIQLAKNARFAVSPTQAIYDLNGVTIETGDYSLIVPNGADVALNNATVTHTGTASSMAIYVQGNLTISGGRYTTDGGTMLGVDNGTATISGAEFESQNITSAHYTLPVISVEGVDGQLTMESGKITAVDGESTATKGMYGVYVLDGAQVTLGNATAANDAEDNLKINSVCAAVSMNGMTSPGRITINGGTYSSALACTGAEEKFNAVIYLPANANVNINGGTFKETGANSYVFSMPYNHVGNKAENPLLRMNLNIKEGRFDATKGIFFTGPGVDEEGSETKIKGTITKGDFSKKPASRYVASGYKAYERTVDGQTRYTVIPTAVISVGNQGFNEFDEALEAARDANAEVTLSGDIQLTKPEYDFSGVTVNTNGYMITIPEGYTVTLKGGADATAGTIRNTETATKTDDNKWTDPARNHTILSVQGSVTIEGGNYQTAGVKALYVTGKATVGGKASFICTAEATSEEYDGASLVDVDGTAAKLIMTNATVNANVGADDNGMYGIYVRNGAEVTLGSLDSEMPVVTSRFATVAMNATTAPGKITINGGKYTSTLACSAQHEAFNSVLYLPATARVTINGGEFIANGATGKGKRHVISVPHSVVNGKNIKLDLIVNGGTFTVENAVANTDAIFCAGGMVEGSLNSISVRGGTYNIVPGYTEGACRSTTEKDEQGYVTVLENAAGHDLKWVNKKEASCWEEGVIGHYECKNCGKMYKTKATTGDSVKELLPGDAVIAKEDHALDLESYTGNVVTATCTVDGKKPYVKCKKCNKYYSNMGDLQRDSDGSLGQPEEEFITKATGHTLELEVDWTKFSYQDFKEGKNVTVSAKRKCTVDGCGYEEAIATGTTVTLEVVDDKRLIDCEQESNKVTMKATAKFAKDEFGKDLVKKEDETRTDEAVYQTAEVREDVDVPASKHALANLEVDWSEFNASEFVKTQTKYDVTASATCVACGKTVKTDNVKVTCDEYPNSALQCDQSRMFKAEATFVSKGENILLNNGNGEELYGQHILEQLDDDYKYTPATCDEKGHWGYYKCHGCGKFCMGEDSAKNNQWLCGGKTDATKTELEAATEIAVRPHFLRWNHFTWVDKEANTFRTSFLCTTCGKVLELGMNDGIVVGDPTISPEGATCGQDVIESREVKLKLDRYAVVKSTDNTNKLVYDKTKVNPDREIEYKDTMEKPVSGKHTYSATVKWIDTAPGEPVEATDGKIYDTGKGVEAKITCSGCGKFMTITDKNIANYDGDLDILADVSFKKNTEAEGARAATCVMEGKDVYDVKVMVFGEGSAENEIVTVTPSSLETLTPIERNAHNWTSVNWGSWKQIPDPSGDKDKDGNPLPKMATVEIDGKNVTIPVYEIEASSTCQNSGCIAPNVTHKATVGVTTDAETAKGFHVEIEIDHIKKTCVTSGKTTYTAVAYMGTEKIPDDKKGTYATPAVYNYPVTGHEITIDWKWTGDDATGYTAVSATRKCTICSDDTTVDDKYKIKAVTHKVDSFQKLGENENLPFLQTEGMTAGMKGENANCEKAGKTIYQIYVRFGDTTYYEEKEVSSDALGHADRWFITWPEENVAYDNPAWVVKAERKCINPGCPRTKVVQKTIEFKKDNTAIQYTPSTATCLKDGEEKWVLEFNPQDFTEVADKVNLAEGVKLEEVRSISHETVSHTYNPGTVTWDDTAVDDNGRPIGKAIFTRTCSMAPNDPTHTEIVEQPIPFKEGDITDCEKNETLSYEVTAPTGWTMAENQELTHERIWIGDRANHNPERVEAEGGNCNAPGWKAHYRCKICGRRFERANCAVEYIPSTDNLGHLYGTPRYQWKDGEEGKVAEAKFTCTRDGCKDADPGHEKVVEATLHPEDLYVETAPKCEGVENNEGYGFHLVTVDVKTAFDNIKVGDGQFEDELGGKILPVDHHYVNGSCEWCGRIEPNTVKAIFYGPRGVQSQVIVYRASEESYWIEPTVIAQSGSTFRGWKINNTGETIETNVIKEIIKSKLPTDPKAAGVELKIYAYYESPGQNQGSIKIVKVYGTVVDDTEPAVENLKVGTIYTVNAELQETKDGKTYHFKEWQLNGVAVSTSTEYGVYIQDEVLIEIQAIYAEEQAEEKPIVTITGVQGNEDAGSKSLEFTSSTSIPEEYTVEERGFLFTLSASVNDNEIVYETENSKIKKQIVTGTKTNILTIAIPSGREGSTVRAMAYVRYKKPGSDDTLTLYSELKSSTWNAAHTATASRVARR